jgi:hypothetical protein
VRIIRQILRHLIECPEAIDTAAGILQWWLKADQLMDAAELEAILEVMVAEGWLVETKAGSSLRLYGVNGNRLEDIRGFLDRTAASEIAGI